MKFSAEKYLVIKLGKNRKIPDGNYTLGAKSLQVSDKNQDLGVVIRKKYVYFAANIKLSRTYVNGEIIKEIIR